jgi:GMP synthase PP-ATPase subunit
VLGQGTLRPDLIESASGLASITADVIKTHHNDTDLVRKLRAEGRVVEPLVDFHKDEVKIPLKSIIKRSIQSVIYRFVSWDSSWVCLLI